MRTINIGIVGFGNINMELSRQAVALGKINILWIIDRSFRTSKINNSEKEKLKEAAYKNLTDNGQSPKIYNKNAIASVEEVDVIVEATGQDVIEIVRSKRKRWNTKVLFVTANKAMVAKHLSELLEKEDIRLEAAVAAGLPLIKSLSSHISVDELRSLIGIINGTTNFIMCEMQKSPLLSYTEALDKAIERGYAEPGGKGDVDGLDAAFKLLILARIVNLACVDVSFLYKEKLVRGIDEPVEWNNIDCIQQVDFSYAKEYLDSTIKLVAVLQNNGKNKPPLFLIYPMLIPRQSALANIDGPDNYIEIYSKHFGYTDMQGQGAGDKPTACALLADVVGYINKANNPALNVNHNFLGLNDIKFKRFMVRASCYDRPGVLAYIFKHFEEYGVGIDQVFQIDQDDDICKNWAVKMGDPAVIPFVFVTTETSILNLMNALEKIDLNKNNNEDRLFPNLKRIFAVYPIFTQKFNADNIKEFIIDKA